MCINAPQHNITPSFLLLWARYFANTLLLSFISLLMLENGTMILGDIRMNQELELVLNFGRGWLTVPL